LPINESWVAVFGTPKVFTTIDSITNYFQRIKTWVTKQHSEFRLGYLILLGGIVSSLQMLEIIESDSMDGNTLNSLETLYKCFHKFLLDIPDNIQIFIVPNGSDFTKTQIPQPAISPKYQLDSKNIHLLTNPSRISLEQVNLVLYNPFHFFKLSSYRNEPERFVIDLLNFNYLNPKIEDVDSISHVSFQECLTIGNELDFLLCNHPSMTQYLTYKKVSIGLISCNNVDNRVPVLIFNLHSRKYEIQEIMT
jgi:DNA polymerase II small subunit/DNA polymerase delta subunit B